MTRQIEAAGRTRVVDVNRTAGKIIVTVDGQAHEVSVSEVGGVMSVLIGTKSYEVSMAPTPTGAMMVHVDGVPVEVTIIPQTWAARGRGGADAHQRVGPQRITAPMPGKIVKVLVKAGDRIQPRQGLVVVEAMKMENELRSRAEGTVTEVRAIEGSSVEAGAILIVVE